MGFQKITSVDVANSLKVVYSQAIDEAVRRLRTEMELAEEVCSVRRLDLPKEVEEYFASIKELISEVLCNHNQFDLSSRGGIDALSSVVYKSIDITRLYARKFTDYLRVIDSLERLMDLMMALGRVAEALAGYFEINNKGDWCPHCKRS